MKKILFFALSLSISAFSAEWASIYHSLIAFDERAGLPDGNRPGYVKPLATNLGTVLNSNWISSARIPQVFTIEAGMPLMIVGIGDDDRTYANGAPTIFGDKEYEWGAVSDKISCSTAPNCRVVNGNETLNKLGVFTYPYLQLAGSFYHARIALRGMWLPAISELQSFNLFGFGLQYSFGHLFLHELPKALHPFDVSLAFGMNFSGIGYTPDNYNGTLDLDITTTHFMLVLGYQPFKFFEVMLSLGYETSTMESSGHLVSEDPDSYGAEIFPSLSVDGNNGFRMGLAVSFSLGASYHPVVGVDFGTKTSYTTNVLYFKQSFGKEPEIKEKKAKVSDSETEENEATDEVTE
ncbi:MAG: DUF6588 family protein [Fibrobacteraceae bacterium]|nr:DUF6588 family protein [Fibrobacteraceae bacterium]